MWWNVFYRDWNLAGDALLKRLLKNMKNMSDVPVTSRGQAFLHMDTWSFTGEGDAVCCACARSVFSRHGQGFGGLSEADEKRLDERWKALPKTKGGVPATGTWLAMHC